MARHCMLQKSQKDYSYKLQMLQATIVLFWTEVTHQPKTSPCSCHNVGLSAPLCTYTDLWCSASSSTGQLYQLQLWLSHRHLALQISNV